MRRRFKIAGLALAAITLTQTAQIASAAAECSGDIELSNFIERIDDAITTIKRGEDGAESPEFILQRVVVTVTTARTETESGGLQLSLPILDNLGGEARAENTQSGSTKHVLQFKLPAVPVSGEQLGEELAQGVEQAKKAFRNAIANSRYLEPDEYEFESEVGVKCSEGGEISLVLINAGGASAVQFKNSIWFEFSIL